MKFLSEEEKETVWKQLENELKELIPDPKIENEVQLNSDSILENEEDIKTFETHHSPPRKKLRSFMRDSDDDDKDIQ